MPQPLFTRKNLPILGLLLLGLAGIAMVLYATRWGAALSDDSYWYIKPPRDILAGRPFTLSPHYPPGLPFILVPIGWLGIDPQAGIRLLNALCFGLNIVLGGWLVRAITGSDRLSLGAALLMLLAQPLIEVHAWAMSEALFIAFVLATIVALGAYLQNQRLGWLLAAAILAGCSGLTRYAGVATIAAAGLALLTVPGPRRLARRLLDAGGFGLLSGLLYAAYPLIYNRASSEIRTTSGFQLGLPGSGSLTDLFYNTILWVMPGRLARGHETQVFLALLAVLTGLAVLFALLRKTGFQTVLARALHQPHWLALLFFALFSFLVLYQANQSGTYRSPFDFRLLAPTHLALFLAVLCLLYWVMQQTGKAVRWVLIVGFLLSAGLYAQRSLDTVQLYHNKGMGFASAYWAESDIVAYLRGLPASQTLVTTAPMGVYFSSAHDSLLFTAYTPDQLAAFLKEKNGVLVVFQSMPFELYGQNEQAYLSKLRLVKEYSNSAVYKAP